MHAIFIDVGYLQKAAFNYKLKPDYKVLIDKIKPLGQYRVYMYDANASLGTPGVDDSKVRGKKQFLDAMSRLGIEVRCGRVTTHGQKMVDTWLVTDLVSLAARGKLESATLIAGDQDFIPAIELAKAEGVYIKIYSESLNGRELRKLADEWQELDKKFLVEIARPIGEEKEDL